MRYPICLMLLLGAVPALAADNGALPEALRPYAGRVMYVDFWASWCAPCAQSFPWLNEMHERYGDRLTVIGVNVDTSDADAQRFLSRHPAQFQIVRDPRGALAEHYKIQGMPSSVILDAQGRVLHQHAGFRSGEIIRYEDAIRQALPAGAAKTGSPP